MKMRRLLCGCVAAGLLLPGCLTPKTVEPTRFYTVSPERLDAGEAVHPGALGIRPLLAARPYKLEVAYRAETNRLAYFPKSEWAELPGTLVSRALADGMARNQLFEDTGDASTMSRPDYLFTGELRRFEADYAGDAPAFVVEASLNIRAAVTGEGLWRDVVEVRVPIGPRSPLGATNETLTEIAQAASDAITELTEDAIASIRARLKNRSDAPE